MNCAGCSVYYLVYHKGYTLSADVFSKADEGVSELVDVFEMPL